MKIEFSHIEITNFLSYGNNKTVVNLQSTNPILILGKNYVSSTDGSDSNGAGKSSILNAILFCLYDKVLSNITKDKLINNINKKDLVVTLYLCVNDVKYKIQRYRKNKSLGGDGVKIFKNGNDKWEFNPEDDCTPDSTSNSNKFIEKLLGKSFDIFSRIVVFSATNNPFLSLSSPEQIQFLEELFGYSEVSERAEQIKEAMKISKQNLEKENAVNETIKNEIERINNKISHLKQMRENWIFKQEQSLKTLNEKLSSFSDINISEQRHILNKINMLEEENRKLSVDILETERKIADIENNNKKFNNWEISKKEEIERLEKQLKDMESVDISQIIKTFEDIEELEGYLKCADNELDILNKNILDKTKNIQKLSKEIESLKDNKCPYCEQEFINSKHRHTHVSDLLKDEKIKVSELQLEISEITSVIENIKSEISEKREICGNWTPNTINKMSNDLLIIKEKIKNISESTNPYTLQTCGAFDFDVVEQNKIIISQNENQIKKLKNKCKFSRLEEIIKHESEIEHINSRLEEIKNETNPYDEPILEMIEKDVPETRDKQINELQKLIKHQDFLIKLLTKKDSFVRKYLLQKNLPLLNNRLKLYLNKMGLPHKVTFLENMSAEIKQFDTVLDFNQLSSGQKARINLALSFAFRDVLQYRHGFVNFCMLDECLDVGLSNTGVQLAVKFIKEIAKEQNLSLFIISHRDEATSMFDNKIYIEYKNGFSNIIST